MTWISTTRMEEEHICRYDLDFTVVELKVKRIGNNWHCYAFGKELVCPVTEATLDRAKANCIRMARGIAKRFLAAVKREDAREHVEIIELMDNEGKLFRMPVYDKETDYSAWQDVMLVLRKNVVNLFPGSKELLNKVRIIRDPATGDSLFIWQGVHWDHGGPTEQNFVDHLEDVLETLRPDEFLYVILYQNGDVYVAGDYEDNNFHIKPKHCLHFIDPSKDVWESEYTRGYQTW